MGTRPGGSIVGRLAREVALDRGADGAALPSWRDGWVRALLALTLALQAWAWLQIEGYQIADSVEYMEIAQVFVHGEERTDASVNRPFGFSLALIPFFALADWLGLRDLRALVWAVTLLEMLLGCALVLLTARIGARLGGRACALAAGFLTAANPVFLQYSTQPESGIPAGVCVALALELLLVRGSLRRGLAGGLLLGAAFLVAYKTLLVALVLLPLLALRDRWKHRSTWLGGGLGLCAVLLVQAVIDRFLYGSFGLSIVNYLAQNAGSVATSFFLKIHARFYGEPGVPIEQQGSWALGVAHRLYDLRSRLTGHEWEGPTDITVRGRMGPWFYVTELPTMIVWPGIALLAAGCVRVLTQRRSAAWILLAVFAANFAAMSNKGQKEFRLWLPLLALLMPIAGLGWSWIASSRLARRPLARAAVAGLLGLAIGALGLREFAALETRKFGGYWAAQDWVNARARETLPARIADAHRRGLSEPEGVRVASAYHWALFLRQSPLVEPVKLSWQLNLWKQYPPGPLGIAPQHAADFVDLDDADVFLVHLPILSNHPELLRWVAARFEVAAAFHDQATYGDLGPIFVLERRTADPRGRRFLEIHDEADPRAFAHERQLAGAMDFLDPLDPDGERLELLGVEYQDVPPLGFGWITYHWHAPRKLVRDWSLIDRITAPDETAVWDNGHRAAYGAWPTQLWEPGSIVSEGHLVVPASEPYRPGGAWRPIGGGYRRGDLIPVRVWLGVRSYGAEPAADGSLPVEAELLAARPGARNPLRTPGEAAMQMPDGAQFSADGLVRVRGLLLPVMPRAKAADDGRPLAP